MLMMLDPHVHFHVFPRYEGERSAQATTFADASWPGPPDLSQARKLSGDQLEGLRDWLSGLWPEARRSVVEGKRLSVSVDHGGRRSINKKHNKTITEEKDT